MAAAEFHLPGRVLMENAGRGATRFFLKQFPDIENQRVGVIAGRGNNGGDGLVAGRYLAEAGANVAFYLTKQRDPQRDENYAKIQQVLAEFSHLSCRGFG